jgi:hypothetical protein
MIFPDFTDIIREFHRIIEILGGLLIFGFCFDFFIIILIFFSFLVPFAFIFMFFLILLMIPFMIIGMIPSQIYYVLTKRIKIPIQVERILMYSYILILSFFRIAYELYIETYYFQYVIYIPEKIIRVLFVIFWFFADLFIFFL